MALTPFHLFDQTITVYQQSAAVDSGGSPVLTFATARVSNIAARVQPMSGSEAVRYGRESNRRMYRIFVAPGQGIVEEDRISWSSKTLDIVEVTDLQAASVVTRIIAEETD